MKTQTSVKCNYTLLHYSTSVHIPVVAVMAYGTAYALLVLSGLSNLKNKFEIFYCCYICFAINKISALTLKN